MNPPTVIFRKVEKKKINNLIFLKKNFLFYPPTLNINCLVEINNIFLRFCLCIFESDTVKSDCPVQIFRKKMKYLKITLLVLLFVLEILKKNNKKKLYKKK